MRISAIFARSSSCAAAGSSEQTFVDLVALCQFLPGPASSQTGFAIGLIRAGYGGALAAWAGFTLPSAILMVLFAYGAGTLSGPIGTGLLHGLKLVAVAIVAQAVWGMARSLCPDRARASIATLSALDHPVQHVLGGADRGNRARRRARPMALPRSAADDGGPYRHPGIAPRRLLRR